MTEKPRNVKEAAKLLDNQSPDWYTKIDVDKLDMDNGSLCILGQLAGSFIWHAIYTEGLYDAKGPFGSHSDIGSSNLRRQWIEEINKRIDKPLNPWDALRKPVDKPPIGVGVWQTSHQARVEITEILPHAAKITINDFWLDKKSLKQLSEFCLELAEQLQ